MAPVQEKDVLHPLLLHLLLVTAETLQIPLQPNGAETPGPLPLPTLPECLPVLQVDMEPLVPPRRDKDGRHPHHTAPDPFAGFPALQNRANRREVLRVLRQKGGRFHVHHLLLLLRLRSGLLQSHPLAPLAVLHLHLPKRTAVSPRALHLTRTLMQKVVRRRKRRKKRNTRKIRNTRSIRNRKRRRVEKKRVVGRQEDMDRKQSQTLTRKRNQRVK